ncbi:hypothetical protein EYC80_002471 [Monilinia laxa]|uniref:Uncharacterized protein n=1 Tax=Monilinia laxa TaxID=61186 RepID=A0A5N6K442_MONLA|nr:hypothetical protein EYC80_002471 [Monilinia laxa]
MFRASLNGSFGDDLGAINALEILPSSLQKIMANDILTFDHACVDLQVDNSVLKSFKKFEGVINLNDDNKWIVEFISFNKN